MFWQLAYLERKYTNAKMLKVAVMIMTTGIQLLIFKQQHSGRADNGFLFGPIILKKGLVWNAIKLLVCAKHRWCKHIFLIHTALPHGLVFCSCCFVHITLTSNGSPLCNEMTKEICVIPGLDIWINRKFTACTLTPLNNSVANNATGTLVWAR